MESVDLLGRVIYSIPARRQLWQQRSNRDRQSFWKNDIRGIRARYRKGNGQTRKYRGLMNGWSFSMAQRQLEYKARWAGLPIIRLSRRETRGSSVTCPRCGERLQSDKRLGRRLWCGKCRVVMDRDRVAAVILARQGRVRFARSRPTIILEAQGGAAEAVKGNPTPTVIPGVDASKPTPTESRQNQIILALGHRGREAH